MVKTDTPYSTHNRPVLEHLLCSNPEGLSPTAELECTHCLQENSTKFNLGPIDISVGSNPKHNLSLFQSGG